MGMLVRLGAWHSQAAARVWHGERSDPSGGPLSLSAQLSPDRAPRDSHQGPPAGPRKAKRVGLVTWHRDFALQCSR